MVCDQCGAPLGAELDCFAALELPKKLRIDSQALEAAYHRLGRRIHPDRFSSGSAAVRSASLRGTALLTRSYRTLRDPVSRGLYWLEFSGQKLGENNQNVPPELAATVFEVQEELAEMRDAAPALRAGFREKIEGRRAELEDSMTELKSQLDANFAAWDASGEGDHPELMVSLKGILSRIAYLRTLIRDVDRELENLKAA